MDNDTIIVKDKDGNDEEVELILSINKNDKEYLLYRNKENEIYASYLLKDSDELHNDLTDEEFNMLEAIYLKGSDIYDK